MLEKTEEQDVLDAQRNLVLLVSDIVTCGFLQLQPTLSDPGPFNPNFKIPVPAKNGQSVWWGHSMVTVWVGMPLVWLGGEAWLDYVCMYYGWSQEGVVWSLTSHTKGVEIQV